MEIIIAKNKENWGQADSFAQDWEWGEVLRAEGQEVERLLIKEGETVAKAQIVYKTLPFGWRYTWCAKGPEIKNSDVNVYNALVDYLGKKKCVFLRFEPSELPAKLKLSKSRDISPKATAILDLTKSEEELLAGMKKNTRYSIRFAEKQNLVLKNESNLEVFWKLLNQTAVRDKFTTHPKEHYQHILAHSQVWQLTAYKDNAPVASAIFIGSGDTVTYLFAASDYSQHQLLAPYLIQWEAIKTAKRSGYKKYDFFGIAPGEMKGGEYVYNRNHHYAGITKFKLGFGGTLKIWPGTFDIILDKKKYLVYKILHFIYGIRKIGR